MSERSDEPGARDAMATITRAVGRTRVGTDTPVRLRAVFPRALDWTLRLSTRAVTLGRTGDEKVPGLGHDTVSRRHLEITWDGSGGTHVARDLGSHNGSRVDGEDIGERPVAVGDGSVIQLGDVVVVLEVGRPGDDVGASVSSILGRSPAAGRLREAIARAAPDPSPVLLVGETGTGKEWVARELHRSSGRSGPLVSVNCSALNPTLVDSQLFGHVRGAFTGSAGDHPGLFRSAEGGTLFLDEIGEMPLELQPKLLRALQEAEIHPVGASKPVKVDVRVVAATNRELGEAIERGVFRRDLYARLSLWEIRVPPLRERPGDVLDWIDRLYQAWRERRPGVASEPIDLGPEAVEQVLVHPWPSNLRQIDRLVHELCAEVDVPRPIAWDRLPAWARPGTEAALLDPGSTSTGPGTASPGPAAPASARKPVPDREEFAAAFHALAGNVRALAKHFARDRRQIYRWIESYGLADQRRR